MPDKDIRECPATIVAHEHLFGEERPFAQCHASTIVALDGGERFLAAWFGGTREGRDDVAIWLAERDARGRWSPPRRVAKVRPEAHWNPVLFVDPKLRHRVHLFFKVGSRIETWETWTTISEDSGATWGEPRPLVSRDGVGGRGPVKNKPIALVDGAWLAGASYERDGRWDIFIDRSEDGGRTWQATELLPLDRAAVAGRGVIQPALWESGPGRVHLLARSTGGAVCRSDSGDGGRTWSPVRPIRLPNNNSGLDVARLPDGTLALAHNPVGRSGERTPLVVSVSSDNGETWPRRITVWTAPGEFSYPAILALPDGGLALTYTSERTRIAFWKAIPCLSRA